MKRTIALIFLLTAYGTAASSQQPTAEQILDRYIEVTGGAEAYKRLQQETSKAKITVPGTPFEAEATSYSTRSGKYFSVINLPGGWVQHGISGDIAWEHSSASGPRILTGAEREASLATKKLFRTAEWRGLFETVELIGTEKVGDAECYKIRLVPKSGRPEFRFFDRQTGLLLKMVEPTFSKGELVDATGVLSDYREVDGIKAPYEATLTLEGITMKVEVKSLSYTAPIPDVALAMTPEVKALLGKVRKGTALPDAETLLNRHVQASGGLDALREVKSQTLRGKMEFPDANISGRTTLYQNEAGQSYQVIDIPGAGKVELGNNGDVEWERSTLKGPRVKRIAPTPGAFRQPSLLSQTFWHGRYSRIETVGTDVVDGKPCYKVRATLQNGGTEYHCYDRETGLLSRTSIAVDEAGGNLDLVLSDYRAVGRLKAPFFMRTEVVGQKLVIHVEDMKLNETIAPEIFELPEDIKALVAKQQKPAQLGPAKPEPTAPKQ